MTQLETKASNQGRQMQLMLADARAKLRSLDPAQIAANSGAVFENGALVMESLGTRYSLDLETLEFDREPGMWHCLTLMQYLFTSDGSALSGRFIALAEMPGGFSRGHGFDKDISLMFERGFAQTGAEDFAALCRQLGGREIAGRADVNAEIMYAPRFPVRIAFNESDDEFPCTGKAFVDAEAQHYLTMEAAGGACSATVQMLLMLKNGK